MRKTKRIVSLSLSVIAIVALTVGCAAPNETPASEKPDNSAMPNSGEPVMGGELTVGIAQDLDKTMDPHEMVSAGTREVLFNVFEGLMKPDTEGNMVPAVAKDYSISEDGTVFTFTLREDVKFHNGQTVTADDVVYSLTRASTKDPESGAPLMDGFVGIESIEKTDESTITVTLSEPNIEFLAMFTVAIIPKDSDPAEEVLGTGPFEFVSRTPQETVVLEKFDEYWGDPAYVDSVTYKIIDNSEALVMALKGKSLDLVAHLTSTQVAELGDTYNVEEGTMNLIQALYLNNAVEPFNNVKVRQALCYAVDRQEVMDILADGMGAAIGSSIYPAFDKYFNEDLVDYYTRDIDKAKELLEEAGYADGFSFDVTVPSNYQPHVDTATVLAKQLEAIGVKMNVTKVDWNTWVSDTYLGRNFEATVIGVDAKTMTARALLERFTSDFGENFINFNNQEYDKTFKEAIACTDDAEQTQLYGRLQEILTEQAANVYIQDMCDLVVMQSNVGGYEFYPLYVMDMSKVYFTE